MRMSFYSHQHVFYSINKVWKVAMTLIILLHLIIQLQIEVSIASAHSHKAHRKHASTKHSKSNDDHMMHGESSPPYSNIFDVLSFGAIGDGATDDTQAFQAAWQQACQVESAIFEVPEYFTFVVRPIVFSGPCAPNIVFQIDGSIVAPANPSKWGASRNLLQWINFSKLHNTVIQGGGLVNGMGPAWWSGSQSKGRKFSIRPTAMRFYGSYNVTVQNLRIQNSPQTHLKFDSCIGVTVNNISILSPPNSPNTDGIHLQNTQFVEIHNSYIENGDDCISIQTGSSNLNIHNVICEAGHGISLGGLGRAQTQACVSNVTVHDVTIRNSQNGVRIKTWQGGSGAVKAISYSNVNVVNISNPIIIDQFYCDSGKCKNQSSAVQVSGVTYRNIRGTYSKSSPLHFACSDTVPCTAITVAQVELLPQRGYLVDEPFCWNIYGSSQMPTIPPVHCLQTGLPRPSSKGIKQSSFDDVC